MVLREGEPLVAFGTPGGDQQDQWQSIFFLRHVIYDFNLQEAIDTPSFHSEHFVDLLYHFAIERLVSIMSKDYRETA